MKTIIESTQNKYVKTIVSLKQKKQRDLQSKFIIEGYKFVKNIPFDWCVNFFAVSETFALNNCLKALESRAEIIYIKDSIFNTITNTITPQGIVAVCEQKKYDLDNIFKKENAFFIILEHCSDPGNLGSIIRTADAASASAVFICSNSVEIYNPKVVRSTAGSIFNIPFFIINDIEIVLNKCKENNIKIIATHLNTENTPYDLNLKQSIAFIIGNEAVGITKQTSENADVLVKLPILGKAESLNASIACAIMIYEVVRQRTKN